jgi:hypothetical protein
MIVAWIKKIAIVFSIAKRIFKNRDVIETAIKDAIARTKDLDINDDGKVSASEFVKMVELWVKVLQIVAPDLDYLVRELKDNLFRKSAEANVKGA